MTTVVGILRNFRIVNVFLSFAIRFCLKKTGPGESILMMIATMSIGNARTMIAQRERIISKNGLITYLYTSINP